MKKANNKGFTIIELVIVIAAIAILAAVLIPTFSNVIEKANQSSALQSARNVYTELMAETNADLDKLGIAKIEKTADADINTTAVDETEVAKILTQNGATSVTYTKAVTEGASTAPASLDIVVDSYTVTFTLDGTSDPVVKETN